MAKKGGKLFGVLALGAAAAGAYYYYKKKNSEIPANMDDDEDLDNFDSDVEDAPKAESTGKRSYVNLNFNTVEKKVQDTVDKFADSAEKTANTISSKLQTAAGKVEEFFDDRKTAAETDLPTDSQESEEAPKEASEEKSGDGNIPIE